MTARRASGVALATAALAAALALPTVPVQAAAPGQAVTAAKPTPAKAAPKRPHPKGNRNTTPAKRPHPKGTPAPKRPHPKRKPWPVTLTVQTLPALPGAVLTFDGRRLVTDASGKASYTSEHDLRSHALTLLSTSIDSSDQHFHFARWVGQRNPDDTYLPGVTGLPMRADYTVTAAFSVQYPVSATFSDQHGRPIPLDRISSVLLRGDSGQPVPLPTSGTIWLTGLTPQLRKGALTLTPVVYSLQQLTVDGAQVADSGKQVVQPSSATTRNHHGQVGLVGQFHDLTVSAHDALFSGTTGRTAEITGPDGRIHTAVLGADHRATFAGLPRGHYTVSVHAGGGIVLSQEVQLSQDHLSDVSVISGTDVGTIGGAVALIALLLLLGRLRLRRRGAGPGDGPLRLLLRRSEAMSS